MARPKLAKRVKRKSRSVSMTDAAWRAYETRATKCGYVSVSAYLNDAALGKLPTWDSKESDGKGDHVVMGNESGPCGYCPHCGDTFPIPIGDLGWAVAVMRAFGKAHRNCKPGTMRGHRLCGLQAVDGLHSGIPLEKEQPCPKP